MTLSSMTGFARSHGVSCPYAWAWEIKSVNGKGLDLRLRLRDSRFLSTSSLALRLRSE